MEFPQEAQPSDYANIWLLCRKCNRNRQRYLLSEKQAEFELCQSKERYDDQRTERCAV